MNFPDDCLQTVIVNPSPWWIADTDPHPRRGSLVYAFVPHADQVPWTLAVKGRTEPTEHSRAEIEIRPLQIRQSRDRAALPVAAMTLLENEVWSAYRAKKRPCLMLGNISPLIPKTLTRGKPNWSTAPVVLCAPYYGAVQERRAGYSEDFVERVRHCEYPGYFWDFLPIPRGISSILRLDQMQPIGIHNNSFEMSGFRLSDDALTVMDELISWVVFGGVPEDQYVASYRQFVESEFGAAKQ